MGQERNVKNQLNCYCLGLMWFSCVWMCFLFVFALLLVNSRGCVCFFLFVCSLFFFFLFPYFLSNTFPLAGCYSFLQNYKDSEPGNVCRNLTLILRQIVPLKAIRVFITQSWVALKNSSFKIIVHCLIISLVNVRQSFKIYI